MEVLTVKPAIRRFRVFLFITCSFVYSSAVAQQIGLTNPSTLELNNVQAEVTTYRGAQALRLTEKEGDHPRGVFAMVKNLTFRNGTIDMDVSGTPAKGA